MFSENVDQTGFSEMPVLSDPEGSDLIDVLLANSACCCGSTLPPFPLQIRPQAEIGQALQAFEKGGAALDLSGDLKQLPAQDDGAERWSFTLRRLPRHGKLGTVFEMPGVVLVLLSPDAGGKRLLYAGSRRPELDEHKGGAPAFFAELQDWDFHGRYLERGFESGGGDGGTEIVHPSGAFGVLEHGFMQGPWAFWGDDSGGCGGHSNFSLSDYQEIVEMQRGILASPQQLSSRNGESLEFQSSAATGGVGQYERIYNLEQPFDTWTSIRNGGASITRFITSVALGLSETSRLEKGGLSSFQFEWQRNDPLSGLTQTVHVQVSGKPEEKKPAVDTPSARGVKHADGRLGPLGFRPFPDALSGEAAQIEGQDLQLPATDAAAKSATAASSPDLRSSAWVPVPLRPVPVPSLGSDGPLRMVDKSLSLERLWVAALPEGLAASFKRSHERTILEARREAWVAGSSLYVWDPWALSTWRFHLAAYALDVRDDIPASSFLLQPKGDFPKMEGSFYEFSQKDDGAISVEKGRPGGSHHRSRHGSQPKLWRDLPFLLNSGRTWQMGPYPMYELLSEDGALPAALDEEGKNAYFVEIKDGQLSLWKLGPGAPAP